MAKKLEKIIKLKIEVVRVPEIDIILKVIDFYDAIASVNDHRYKF